MNEYELSQIVGGAKYGKIGVLGGIIVFLLGVLDGYINPSKCNNK